jgi:excisionase family DNA binding protein
MNQQTQTKMWLTAQEAADEIGVHVETIRRYVRQGNIKAIKIGPSSKAHVRIHVEDWKAWLKEQLRVDTI